MKKTLVVLAHPDMENSRANKAFKEEAEKLSNVELYNIYEKYPDGKIDVEKELKLLSETGTLILQFPLYWFNCPSLLKEWIDTVFMAAHYGENKVLKGKKIGVAVTTGGIASRYDGTNGLTIKEVLKPFLLSIAYVEGIELPIYSLYGAMPDLSDEKIAEKYYNLLKRSYKGTPVMDLVEILNDNLEMISFLNTLGDYLNEEDNSTNNEANDLPDGFLYDEKNGIIQNKNEDESDDLDEAEDTEEDSKTYSESIKEILDDGKDTIKSQKEETSKYKRIVDYFKIDKNQKEFGIPNDYVRGFELKIAEIEIAKNMMNYGVGSAVKYYLDNVSTKDVSYEDVYFNEQSELELYLAVAQMLAVADESVVNKYRKDFENTRVIKLLDEVLKNERKKEKDKIENPDKNSKKHIKG